MSLTVKRDPKIHFFTGDVDLFFEGLEEKKDIVDGDNMEKISDQDRQDYNSYQIIKQTDGSFTYKQRNSGIDTMSITFTLDRKTDVATYFEFLKGYNNNVYSGDKIVVEAEAQGAHEEYIIIRDGIANKLRCALRKNSDGIQEITFTFFEESGYSPQEQFDHLEGIAEAGDTMKYIRDNGKFTSFDITTGKNRKLILLQVLTGKRSSTSSGKNSTSSGKSSSSSGRKSKKGKISGKRGAKRRRTRKGSR